MAYQDDNDHDLFAYTHARLTDPDTSVEAAESISPRLRELQARVLAYAAQQPDGFTDRDLEAAMGDSGSTWRTRRSELTERGFIKDSGERRTYPPKGRRHIIWQITLDGLKEAQIVRAERASGLTREQATEPNEILGDLAWKDARP